MVNDLIIFSFVGWKYNWLY